MLCIKKRLSHKFLRPGQHANDSRVSLLLPSDIRLALCSDARHSQFIYKHNEHS